MTAAAYPVLVFTRTPHGAYTARPEGSATEFYAVISRASKGPWWYVHMTVFGRPLDTGYRATLTEARDYAAAVYHTVETAAR